MIYLLVVCWVVPTAQWSGDAHRAIAAIAMELLNANGKTFLAQQFGVNEESLRQKIIEMSTSADSIEWSGPLHFADTPQWTCAPFDMERDCRDARCIVTAIGNFTNRATDITSSREDRSEALMFLIHLVADIHNPMHVAFKEDLGGNSIILGEPADVSLHEVWDDVLIKIKQRELGVYPEDPEEDSKPWLLSDALLVELGDKRSRQKYLLNIAADNFENEASGVEVAARMANQTATEYTCIHAYMKSQNDWIVSGDFLGSEYLESRVNVAMELLKFSSVRLAEIINSLASLYFHRKQKKYQGSRVLDLAHDENIYLQLPFSFDPNTLLEEDAAEEVRDDWLDGLITDTSKGSKYVGRNKGRKSSKKNSSCREDRKKKTESKSAIVQDEEPDMFEGVDLNQVILLKRLGLFLVTGKSYKGRRGLPVHTQLYSIVFGSNTDRKPVDLHFDMEFLRHNKCSRALIAKMLAKIAKVDFNADSILDFEKTEPGAAYLEMFSPYFVEADLNDLSGPFPTFSQAPSISVMKRVCCYRFGKATLFVLAETIEMGDPVMQTNLYRFTDITQTPPVNEIWLIDERLFAGAFPRKFHNELVYLHFNHQRLALSQDMLPKRPTILNELRDLDTIFFSERFKALETVKWVKELPVDDVNYYRFQWSILKLAISEISPAQPLDVIPHEYIRTSDIGNLFIPPLNIEQTPVDPSWKSPLLATASAVIILILALLLSFNS